MRSAFRSPPKASSSGLAPIRVSLANIQAFLALEAQPPAQRPPNEYLDRMVVAGEQSVRDFDDDAGLLYSFPVGGVAAAFAAIHQATRQ